jgi:hypothetical protein
MNKRNSTGLTGVPISIVAVSELCLPMPAFLGGLNDASDSMILTRCE